MPSLEPPAQYAHAYAGIQTEHVETMDKIEAACPKERGRVYGCSIVGKGWCISHIPVVGKGGVSKWLQARIKAFENSHCNGMVVTHENCALCRYLASHGY